MSNKRGIQVTCTVCERIKAPRGRSLPWQLELSYCHADILSDMCPGYLLDPKPGDLFPGETSEEFGYHCSDNATEICE